MRKSPLKHSELSWVQNNDCWRWGGRVGKLRETHPRYYKSLTCAKWWLLKFRAGQPGRKKSPKAQKTRRRTRSEDFPKQSKQNKTTENWHLGYKRDRHHSWFGPLASGHKDITGAHQASDLSMEFAINHTVSINYWIVYDRGLQACERLRQNIPRAQSSSLRSEMC